ncbi:hypothetical protein [Algoriphagus jejuensis]
MVGARQFPAAISDVEKRGREIVRLLEKQDNGKSAVGAEAL